MVEPVSGVSFDSALPRSGDRGRAGAGQGEAGKRREGGRPLKKGPPLAVRGVYRPVRARLWTQPCIRDLALAMSLSLKKSWSFTFSTAYTGRRKSLS